MQDQHQPIPMHLQYYQNQFASFYLCYPPLRYRLYYLLLNFFHWIYQDSLNLILFLLPFYLFLLSHFQSIPSYRGLVLGICSNLSSYFWLFPFLFQPFLILLSTSSFSSRFPLPFPQPSFSSQCLLFPILKVTSLPYPSIQLWSYYSHHLLVLEPILLYQQIYFGLILCLFYYQY